MTLSYDGPAKELRSWAAGHTDRSGRQPTVLAGRTLLRDRNCLRFGYVRRARKGLKYYKVFLSGATGSASGYSYFGEDPLGQTLRRNRTV